MQDATRAVTASHDRLDGGREDGGLGGFFGPNAGYVVELLERMRREPESLDPALRAQLAELEATQPGPPAGAEPFPAAPPSPSPPGTRVPPAAGAAALAQAIRYFGHLAAQLDPLGEPPPGDPQLELAAHDLTETDLADLPADVVGGPVAREARTALDAIQRLREIYSSTTGYELGHVESPEERAWLVEAVEERRFRPPADPVDERELLDRLTEVSAFERFLQRAYPGQTRFSIEGLGMLIPMLDELIARAGESGARSILLGMAHRGRLNVLAHVLGKPYERILAEFEGRVPSRRAAPSEGTDEGWTGDVKYHAGAERRSGAVSVRMAPNPSHLEAVDPVVQGMARAADEDRQCAGRPCQDEVASLAVLVHGDAAFPGQGVVAETLNLSRLPSYSTGGTIHLIENNQLGFTTNAREGRSTLYASDLAKGFEIPIVHVNADDPIACLAAVRLAVAYRARFRKDFLVDLVGYRRWGHNEGDEPSFTQPVRYARIAQQATVRERYVADLERRGALPPGEADRLLKAGLDEFQRLREKVTASPAPPVETVEDLARRDGQVEPPPSPRPASVDELRELNEALLRFPEGFTPNPKLERALQRRRAPFEREDARLDWGHAETLAFATILKDGTPVRLTGQDVVRGTFSQRHLTFYDGRTGAAHTTLEALPGVQASFEVANSPLSENAALGFEYGYSVQAPDALVLWEAQYGDFVNGAQVVVDEFVVSAQAKWGLRSGLVMLLPHAWEGQGPDHSGGRLERFLQLCAENNVRVANCTTAAQYFHLLRRQAASLGQSPRPLVVMTPKSLLRHPLAASPVAALAEGGFRPVLDDPRVAAEPDRVRRLAFCSGHVWAEVEGKRDDDADGTVALVRLEELYPFPEAEIQDVLARYARAEEVVWLQEEPRNMGAWTYMEPLLRDLLGDRQSLRYVGRPPMASPAEGWAHAHAAEQRRIVELILEGAGAHDAPRKSGPRRPPPAGGRGQGWVESTGDASRPRAPGRHNASSGGKHHVG